VFAKIENHEGVKNYEEILSVADGIIINRLNLSLEFPPHKAFLVFKWLTERAI
jgi:pyruvate kinase